MSERVLGFDSEGMQKGKKYVTFRTDKLVPVVSKEEHDALKKACQKEKLELLMKIHTLEMANHLKKAGVQEK